MQDDNRRPAFLQSPPGPLAGDAVTVRQFRATVDRAGELATVPAGVTIRRAEQIEHGWWISPETVDAGAPVILYHHGGGYVGGSLISHQRLVGHLVMAAGCRALFVDYRLAPEHPHPAALEDMVAAYLALLGAGGEPARIAFVGDSAGGGMVFNVMVRIRRLGVDLPTAAMVMSPWTDLTCAGQSMRTRATRDKGSSRALLESIAELVLDGGAPDDPSVSPLFADLSGLPPVYLQVGSEEVLLDDARRIADRLEAAGVPTRLDVIARAQHLFQLRAGSYEPADRALALIADFLSEHFDTDPHP